MTRPPNLQCAIYTRKSTEEGLEQEFNSLDAQREACAAYIVSQRGLGWKVLSRQYDDAGLSGGTMERPALRALLEDIQHGKIDVVVVYKIDRLTRSLMDFAKIIDVFDRHQVSFVSVTQQFNTTTSMGRLTLNVLLSFAQFEREVTAERIRDKIAASKRKGMWMGGAVPYGYEVQDRKLIIRAEAADTVRMIYRRYLDLGSVRHLKDELDRAPGAKGFSRGNLYLMLANPIYVGDIRHKGQVFRGQHQAIVDRSIWEAVQVQLSNGGSSATSTRGDESRSVLSGRIFDETGDRLTPSHANKEGKRYRYYISQRLMQRHRRDASGWRLPAHELEAKVISAVRTLLDDRAHLFEALGLARADLAVVASAEAGLASISRELIAHPSTGSISLIRTLVERVDIAPDEMRVTVSLAKLRKQVLIDDCEVDGNSASLTNQVPLSIRRRGVEAKMIIGEQQSSPNTRDANLVATIARARYWLQRLNTSEHVTIASLAREVGVEDGEVSRLLPLAFLAPEIVEAVLEGRQPVELTARRLTRLKPLPAPWHEQRQVLGFA
jgi:DNA invertase Pin-like site-specific DNA recombinase